jgi:16S rRNA (cytidine1402-2'-O)-methyltransferase
VATLALLAEHDPDRPVAVCRELTKLHEEVRRGRADEIGAHYRSEPPRGEVVLVVAAAPPGAQPDAHDRALVALRALVDAGARARPAAKALSELTGVPANRLYRALTERPQDPRP